MMIPVRCMSCSKPLAQHKDEFTKRTADGKEEVAAVLDDLKVRRACCRAVFIGTVDTVDTVSRFKRF